VAKKNADGPRAIAVSNPLFKLLLWIIVGVLFASLIGMALLAFFAPKEQTDFQRQFASMCDTGFKMTLNDRARIGDGVVIPLCGIRCQP
jgi:hypothetical protein